TTGRQPQMFQNYSLSGNRALFEDRLQNGLTISYQPSTQGRNIAVNGNHGLSITSQDVVNFTWNVAFFEGSVSGTRSFKYQKVRLSYNRKLL
ncbi:MAG: hypothetical protein ABIK62_00640, partial [candidate division WOR-3 bacterium]